MNAAIAVAEADTAARIVPVVAAASGRYDRAEDLFGLLLGIVAASVVWLFVPDAQPMSDSWAGYTPATKIAFMAVALLTGFTLGVVLSSRIWRLRQPLIPKAQRRDQVNRAARAAFFDRSIHHAAAGSGLLIYVSLAERRAVLLADEAVLIALTQPALDAFCRDLTVLLAETDSTEALCQVIRRVGEHLAISMPRQAAAQDSLPSELVLLP